MKITDIKTFIVDCFRTNWAFVKVYTDEGVTGVGEATLEYKEKSLVGAVEHIREALIGKDPTNIERLSHDIYRDSYWRCGPVLMSALAAVEMALWDILGKSLNVPVYKLLGGKTMDKVRIYVNGWFAGAKTPEEFGEKARIAVKRGVTAMKWDPFGKSYLEISNKELDTALKCIQAVRDAAGSEVDLLIEGSRTEENPAGESRSRMVCFSGSMASSATLFASARMAAFLPRALDTLIKWPSSSICSTGLICSRLPTTAVAPEIRPPRFRKWRSSTVNQCARCGTSSSA